MKNKQKLLAERSDDLAKDVASKSTRSQTSFQEIKTPIDLKPKTGRFTTPDKTINLSSSPSFPIVLSHGKASLKGTCRWDAGSGDRTASPKIAEAAVLKLIGLLESIRPVIIQVVLMATKETENFLLIDDGKYHVWYWNCLLEIWNF